MCRLVADAEALKLWGVITGVFGGGGINNLKNMFKQSQRQGCLMNGVCVRGGMAGRQRVEGREEGGGD